MKFKSGLLSRAPNYPSWKATFDKADHNVLGALTPSACWTHTCIFFSLSSFTHSRNEEDCPICCSSMHQVTLSQLHLRCWDSCHWNESLHELKVGVDYAGPLQTGVKYGMLRKPVIMKSYICIFVSLNMKAVHLKAVSDSTSEAFIAVLRRFACCGSPTLIWSCHSKDTQRNVQEISNKACSSAVKN